MIKNEQIARAEAMIDAAYAVGIANYKRALRKYGYSERDIAEAITEYEIQFAEEWEAKRAEARRAVIAEGEAPSVALH